MHAEGRIHNPAHVEKQWGLNRRLQRKEKRRTFDHLCCLSESQPKTLVASRIHYSNWLQLTPADSNPHFGHDQDAHQKNPQAGQQSDA